MRYILTGIIFGLFYELARLEFSADAIIAGASIGGITGSILALAPSWVDSQRAYNEANPPTIKQYYLCALIAVGIFLCGTTIYLFRTKTL